MTKTRTGKIARLPHHIREELNQRLHDGQSSDIVLPWLNEVAAIVTRPNPVSPISEQNLANWRAGGYQDWLKQQERRDLLLSLAEQARELGEDSDGLEPSHQLSTLLVAELALAAREALADVKDPAQRCQRLQDLLHTLVRVRQQDNLTLRATIQREHRVKERREEEEQEKYRREIAPVTRLINRANINDVFKSVGLTPPHPIDDDNYPPIGDEIAPETGPDKGESRSIKVNQADHPAEDLGNQARASVPEAAVPMPATPATNIAHATQSLENTKVSEPPPSPIPPVIPVTPTIPDQTESNSIKPKAEPVGSAPARCDAPEPVAPPSESATDNTASIRHSNGRPGFGCEIPSRPTCSPNPTTPIRPVSPKRPIAPSQTESNPIKPASVPVSPRSSRRKPTINPSIHESAVPAKPAIDPKTEYETRQWRMRSNFEPYDEAELQRLYALIPPGQRRALNP